MQGPGASASSNQEAANRLSKKFLRAQIIRHRAHSNRPAAICFIARRVSPRLTMNAFTGSASGVTVCSTKRAACSSLPIAIRRSPSRSWSPAAVTDLLWHNPGMGRVELGRTQTRWVADASRLIDYVVTTGESYAGIMERYADLTGHAPVLPKLAAGFWQCKLRYKTQEELLAVAREHKRRGLPMSVIVIDYLNWTKMGEWKFDPDCWPDPSAMVRELEKLGIKVMVSVWPTVNPDSENYRRTGTAQSSRPHRARDEQLHQVHRYERETYRHFHFARHDASRSAKISLEQSAGQLFTSWHQGLVARCHRTRNGGLRPRQRPLPCGQRPRSGMPLSDVPATGLLRRNEIGWRKRHHHPGARGFCREPKIWRGDLVGRHPFHVGGLAATGARRVKYWHERHSVVDYGHRRIFWRRNRHAVFSGVDRALVSIWRVLSACSACTAGATVRSRIPNRAIQRAGGRTKSGLSANALTGSSVKCSFSVNDFSLISWSR